METAAAAVKVVNLLSDVDAKTLQTSVVGVKDLMLNFTWATKEIATVIEEFDPVECDDPLFEFEIRQFQHSLRELYILCKVVINAGRAFAKYATNEAMLKKIREELSATPPRTTMLSIFLKGLDGQLKRCSQRAEEFLNEHDKLVGNLKQLSSEQKQKLKVQKEKRASNKTDEIHAETQLVTVGGVGGVAAAASVGIGLASTGVAIPLALFVLGGTIAGGTVVYAVDRVAAAVTKHYASKLNDKEMALIKQAKKAVKQVQKKANDLKEQHSTYQSSIKLSTGDVEDLNSRKTDALSCSDSEYLAGLAWAMANTLDTMTESMQDVLKEASKFD